VVINKKYKIESDELNVTLYKLTKYGERSPRCGETFWQAIGFFSKPENAYTKLVDLEVMGNGMDNFKTVIDTINSVKADIMKALNESI